MCAQCTYWQQEGGGVIVLLQQHPAHHGFLSLRPSHNPTHPSPTKQIADHVLRQHAYREAGETDTSAPRDRDISDLLAASHDDYASRQDAPLWLKQGGSAGANEKVGTKG